MAMPAGHACGAFCEDEDEVHAHVFHLNPDHGLERFAQSMAVTYGAEFLEARRALEAVPPDADLPGADWPAYLVRFRLGRPITPVPR